MAALGMADMAQLDGSVLVAIPIKSISNATTSVNASLSLSFAVALSASDGFPAGARAPCAAPQFTFYQAIKQVDWGYASSSGRFANQNVTMIQKTNGYTTRSVSGPVPPSPFHQNNTSGFYQSKRFGAYRSCDAEAGGYLAVQASLLDKTSGISFPATGNTVSFLVILPVALPGIVTGIALNTTFRTLFGGLSLFTLIVGHATFCVVTVYNNVIARMRRTPGSLVEASADLGADPWQTFRFITLPVIRSALIAGALLAFALSFDEIIVTTFTAGFNETLPIWIFANLSRPNQLPIVNAVALGVIIASAVPVYLAQRVASDAACYA